MAANDQQSAAPAHDESQISSGEAEAKVTGRSINCSAKQPGSFDQQIRYAANLTRLLVAPFEFGPVLRLLNCIFPFLDISWRAFARRYSSGNHLTAACIG